MDPGATQKTIVFLGRVCVVVFTGVAIWLAPRLGDPNISNSIFTIIQESQGLISPGILAVFVFGLLVRKAPPMAGVIGLLTNIVTYGGMYLLGRYKIGPEIQFLNRMAICFAICLLVMYVITRLRPLPEPVQFHRKTEMDLTESKIAKVAGIAIIAITIALYILFSPIGLAK